MVSLTVVILFFVAVFAGMYLVFGTARGGKLIHKGHHPHRKLSSTTKK
jgi:hypothetical protein